MYTSLPPSTSISTVTHRLNSNFPPKSHPVKGDMLLLESRKVQLSYTVIIVHHAKCLDRASHTIHISCKEVSNSSNNNPSQNKGKKNKGGIHYSIRQFHQQKGDRKSNGVARFVFRQDPLVLACSAPSFRSEEGDPGIR